MRGETEQKRRKGRERERTSHGKLRHAVDSDVIIDFKTQKNSEFLLNLGLIQERGRESDEERQHGEERKKMRGKRQSKRERKGERDMEKKRRK